jgi:hypothetical protein
MPQAQANEVTGKVASLTGVGRIKLRSRVAPVNCREVDGDGTAEKSYVLTSTAGCKKATLSGYRGTFKTGCGGNRRNPHMAMTCGNVVRKPQVR